MKFSIDSSQLTSASKLDISLLADWFDLVSQGNLHRPEYGTYTE